MMRSKIMVVLLFMLFFTLLHDSFISLVEKNDHVSSIHCIGDKAPSSDCKELNKIHGMFHFIAIVTPYSSVQVEFAKKEYMPHYLVRYTPPFLKTSNKPPIV